MSYEAFVLLPNANFTLEQAAKLLEVRFASRPDLKVTLKKNVTVKADDRWQLKVHLNLEQHVIEESAELAQSLEAG